MSFIFLQLSGWISTTKPQEAKMLDMFPNDNHEQALQSFTTTLAPAKRRPLIAQQAGLS